jgi:hypothetical protein
MGYPSLTSWQIKPSNYPKASHHAVTTFASWAMGPLLFMVVFPTIFYKRWIQSLAPHYPIVEGNGKNGHIPFSDNSQRYLATQSLVEGGIPRTSLWHYHEHGIHFEQEWVT